MALLRQIARKTVNGVGKPMNNSKKMDFLQSAMNIMKSRSQFVALLVTP